jgi:CheY-like chemotaxis protein
MYARPLSKQHRTGTDFVLHSFAPPPKLKNVILNAKKRYILLAEDDPDDQYAFSEAFTRLNPHILVKIVQDGQEMMDFLDLCPETRLPVVIVLDYKMPKLTGPDVLRYLAVCRRFNHIPKIVWSTSTRERDMAECLQLGAAHYFAKPATDKELMDFIAGVNAFVCDQNQTVAD